MPFTVTRFDITPLDNPHYVRPVRIHFTLNGRDLEWEAVQSHDSVSILLYDPVKDAFLMVMQFRAPVFMNDSDFTFTYELCAGLIDKDASLKQIAKEEIDEECGYDVSIENIKKITSFFTSVGVSGGRQHLFYAEIDDSIQTHDGGGIHTEEIELCWIPREEAKAFILDETKAKTPGLMFAIYWFFDHKDNI